MHERFNAQEESMNLVRSHICVSLLVDVNTVVAPKNKSTKTV